MTILASDIKLLESERMTDTTDGGGRRTSRVIADGQPGNIFQKVSRLDSVYGRVNMRKVYGHVDTDSVDIYAGTHAAIIDGPDNDKIVVNIFSTASDFDTRSAARDRVESYVISGPESRMTLYGRQLAGQGAFTAIQREEDVMPEVGDVFCLSNEPKGVITTQQYVRVTEVTSEMRTFTDSQGDFQRRIITMKIGSPLRYEFVGWELIESRLSGAPRNSLVRTTTVADANRYFGIRRIAEPALQNALEVRVDSIYSPLVPTTQREVPLSNVAISGASQLVPAAATALPFRPVLQNGLPGVVPSGTVRTVTFKLGSGVMPGTLQLFVADGNDGRSGIATDNSRGTIAAGGTDNGYQIAGGTIDYESGTGTADVIYANGLYDGMVSASYVPAAQAAQPAHTMELPVTLATRGTVQVATLNPLPAKGSAFVDFRALNRWYRLRDDGTGALVGDDPAYGTGTVDPVTGALVATLGALPDVESAVIIGWASPVHFTVRAGATSDAAAKPTQKFSIATESAAMPVGPGTLAISYVSGGVTYNATTSVGGSITGGGLSGKVDYATGQVLVEYGPRLPDADSVLTVIYSALRPLDFNSPLHRTGSGVIAGSNKHFGLPTPLDATQVHINIPVNVPGFARSASALHSVPATITEAGDIVTLADESFSVAAGSGEGDNVNWQSVGGDVIGSIDLQTGTCTLLDGDVVTLRRAFYQFTTGGWQPAANYKVSIADSFVTWDAGLSNAQGASEGRVMTVSTTDSPITLDLTSTTLASVVPGTVMFNAFGHTYFDRNGVIYHSMQADGTGTQAGSIDYASGIVTLTDYTAGTAAANIAVLSCLTRFGDFTAAKAVFRTAGSPLRPAATFVQVTAIDGEQLTALCDQDGTISSANARGKVNQQFGFVSIEWGQMVIAAGNETQDWYDASNVVGSQVWKPREVLPATIRYNSVVISNLPLNADILGLDPVRLPSDGRVPIFRSGDVALLHNTKTTALPNPVAAGATYALDRGDLADCFLIDAAGMRLPGSSYVVDLAAGTVTMAADFNPAGWVAPLSARHRIENLNLISDVQINGQITLSSPLTRDFDEDTMVSGALLFGDLFARATDVFDQGVWTKEWADARIGDDATATYNTAAFPIEVSNSGAETERWRINFLTQNTYQVIGENLGVIGGGSTNADCSPLNPLTGKPYFTIRAGGWGLGWTVANQLRFNTVGATASIWMVRTVLAGATLNGDSVDLQLRGDVDA